MEYNYLNELRDHHKNQESTSVCRKIQERELVTVQEDNLPRGQWKMAVIQDIIKNGCCCSWSSNKGCNKTKSGKMSLLWRLVMKLCPLEVRSIFTDSNETQDDDKLKTSEERGRENNAATRPPKDKQQFKANLSEESLIWMNQGGQCDES